MLIRSISIYFTALLTTIGLVINPVISSAQEEGSILLKPVVVTADRWGAKVDDATDRVTVIDKEEIEKLPARDAAEALNYMVGVTMDRGGSGGAGSIAFPSVQGADYYQTAVMINGIPFNDLSIGLGNIGQIPAGVIDRIEVVHGAGGSEWGSAQGGIINIITHSPDKSGKNFVSAGGGGEGTGFGSVNFQHWTDTVGFSIGAEYRTSDGPDPATTAMENTSGIAGVKAILGDNHVLDFTAFSFQGESGTGMYRGDLDVYSENYIYNTTGLGLTLESDLGFGKIKLTGYSLNETQEGEWFWDGEDIGGYEYEDSILGGSAILRSEMEVATVTAGVDIKDGTLVSTDLIEEEYALGTYGAFVSVEKNIENLLLQVGVRYSDEDYFDSFTGFSLGAKYGFADAPIDIRFSAGQGYTVPTLNQRFYEFPDWVVANPDLTVEKAMTYQLGATARPAEGFSIDVNGFFAILEDAIASVTLDSGLNQQQNIANAERSGVEVEVKYSANGVTAFANILTQEIVDTDTDEVVTGKTAGAYSFGLGYQWEGLFAQFTGMWRDWNADEASLAVDKVWVYGFKAFYKYPIGNNDLTASITVNNLTDVETYSHYMLPENRMQEIEGAIAFSF